MELNNEIERLLWYIYNHNYTKHKVEVELNWGIASISKMKSINVHKQRDLKVLFPKLNINWLIKGEGEPDIDGDVKIYNTESLVKIINEQQEIIKSLNRQIEEYIKLIKT